MKKIVFLLLSALLIFTSCSSFDLSRLNLPLWITNPHSPSGRILFISSATASSEDEARQGAYRSSLDEMSRDLGWDAYTRFYRQMLTGGSIVELEGRVENTYSFRSGDEYTFYLGFSVDADLFDQMRTIEAAESQEREEEIKTLLASSRDRYRDGFDADAFSLSLDALILSLEGPVRDESVRSTVIYSDYVSYYLEGMNLKVSSDSGSINSSASVKRNRGLFHPPVENAPLIFTFTMVESDSEMKTDYIDGLTDSKGRYDAVFTNSYYIRKGAVDVSFNFDEEKLKKLESLNTAYYESIMRIIEEKSVSYTYDESFDFSLMLDAVIVTYDEKGEENEDELFLDGFNSFFSDLMIPFSAVKGEGESLSDVLHSYLSNGDAKPYVLIIRAGITDDTVTERSTAVRVDAHIDVFDTKTQETVYSDYSVFSCGYSEEYKDASDEAFSYAGRLTASAFLTEF